MNDLSRRKSENHSENSNDNKIGKCKRDTKMTVTGAEDCYIMSRSDGCAWRVRFQSPGASGHNLSFVAKTLEIVEPNLTKGESGLSSKINKSRVWLMLNLTLNLSN